MIIMVGKNSGRGKVKKTEEGSQRGHLNQMIVIACENSGMGKVKKTEKVIKVMTDTTDTSVYVFLPA